jgi:hypothetical protein
VAALSSPSRTGTPNPAGGSSIQLTSSGHSSRYPPQPLNHPTMQTMMSVQPVMMESNRSHLLRVGIVSTCR